MQGLTTMNSAEEISKYKESVDTYYSPTLSRRLLGYGYDFPEKSPKKDKKWSLGSLFRRKKKDETESSSDEDVQKKGFLGRKKRKPEKKKKVSKTVGTFDHVVLSRNSHLYSNGYEESGIFSDPNGSYNGYGSRSLPKTQVLEITKKPPANLDDVDNSRTSLIAGSNDIMPRKSRRGLTKVRAEARFNLKRESSSDEDSQRSASSLRFRSDESLVQSNRDGSLSRRSRAARTERYLKRHSRDGESPKDFLRLSKSDAENSILQWKTSDDSNRSLSRSPLVPISKNKSKTFYSNISQSPSISGLSTIPPSHGSNRIKVSNSTSNPSYKPPLSMNDYNYSTRKSSNDYLDSQRSLSCDANIHKSSTEIEPEIIHVQFPLGKPNNRNRNLSLIEPRHVNLCHARQPPPPPPRDPRRLVTAQYYENVRPSTCYVDNKIKSKSFHTNSQSPIVQLKKFTSFNLNPSCRSTSEDYLPKKNVHLIPRPSSATPDVSQRYIQRYPDINTNPENYNYLTDKKPRSRKPIFIRSNNSVDNRGAQKALDFWKKKDKDCSSFKDKLKAQAVDSKSPQMFTCQTHVQTQVFLPSVLQNDITADNLAKSTESIVRNENLNNTRTHISSKENSPYLKTNESFDTNKREEENDEDLRRKSSNLEEALDELEAIYNSLRLGDEDLLERAEQREKDASEKKLMEEERDIYPKCSISRGALSDSSFSYEPFDSVDSPRRKRFIRKSQTIDRRTDDMAFRKLNRERSSTIVDPQGVISKISYLNASPIYGREMPNENEVPNKNSKEPDITLDDVVYRNVKFANNCPKVVEQQPPFGIPLGPITPAANSDYLHAVPDNIHRPTFKPRKIPDLVKDDLAFRNLRKDQSKEPALPPLSPDDLKNNNACEPKLDLNSLKKKRAVRSLSANIGSLINKDILTKGLERYKHNNNSENKESRILTDIADAMEIARQVLKEKENKISATRRAFLSDTDTNNGNDTIAESRMNFLNSLKTPNDKVSYNYLQAKPPRGLTPDRKTRSPKESTPIPVSPFEDKLSRKNDSRDSSLDDLLTTLATEARETNERITNELKKFTEQKRKTSPDDKNLNKYELTKTLSDIDAVSEQAKLCEKLLEGVVDSKDLMASAKPVLEEVEQINAESSHVESVANVILTPDDSIVVQECQEKILCESDHDYENLISDQELTLDEVSVEDIKCTSPFEEHKAELVASFQELKNNVDLDLPATNRAESKETEKFDKENDEPVTGEACVGVLDSASKVQECACVESFIVSNSQTYDSNCYNVVTNFACPQDVDSSSGFCSNCSLEASLGNLDNYGDQAQLDSLKSPKLVLETSKLSKNEGNRRILENQSMICRNSISNKPGTSSDSLMEHRRRNNERDENRHILDDDEKPTPAWYRDPTTMAVACSYGIACAHQLASLDFVAILGLLFAVLSFIAALLF